LTLKLRIAQAPHPSWNSALNGDRPQGFDSVSHAPCAWRDTLHKVHKNRPY